MKKKNRRKCFKFQVYMIGYGETVEEAWEDCQEHFDIDQEPMPDCYVKEEVD